MRGGEKDGKERWQGSKRWNEEAWWEEGVDWLNYFNER